MLVNVILILLYFYYVYNIGRIQKGKLKNIIAIFLCSSIIIVTLALTKQLIYEILAWVLISIVMLLFVLFYDE